MQKNAINILIPNATGPKNVGDQAILYSLLKILRESHNNLKITILSTDPQLYKKERDLTIDESFYGWAMSDSLNFYTKFIRSIQVILGFLFLKLNSSYLIKNKDLQRIIEYHKKADLILYAGGGSLRSDKGLKNVYIFIVLIMIYLYSNLFKVKKILTPISFGPFFYVWQYKITAKILEKSDIISFREKFSQFFFDKYSNHKSFVSTDFALFLKNINAKKDKEKFIVGFTIRNLFNNPKQGNIELSFATALYKLSQDTSIKIQPIVQVNVPTIKNDDDLKATKQVIKHLKGFGVDVFDAKIPKNLNEAISVYGSLNLLLGMRMHSNIIAATQGVPFVAVSYEHKTEGITKSLGVEKYCIKDSLVDDKKLSDLLLKLYKNQTKVTQILEKSLETIKSKENSKWIKILDKSIYQNRASKRRLQSPAGYII